MHACLCRLLIARHASMPNPAVHVVEHHHAYAALRCAYRIEADTPMLCAVLGVKKKDVDWTAAPVPGIFRKHKEVIFTVNPSHKGWRRFVRRILYRYTVRGNFGLVRSVELTVPSRMEVPFSLLDTGGWNGAEEYRSKITLEALADSNIAVLCLVVNHRNVPGAWGAGLGWSPCFSNA